MLLTSRDTALAGLGAAALTAAALAVANFAGSGENGGAAEYAVTLAGSLAVATALFAWGIPRSAHPGRLGLVVGLLGALSLAAFWSGLPFVLGPAAAVLGLRGRQESADRGQATAAVVVGALVTVAATVAVAVDL
jgi:hypothetical protein